ncbi:MAG: F0F1 ATP synthase subunit A [Beijerinckiaceae bacterium]|jgi:F-type H+-transporting ATPase subunit a|nr:F0F1 ATP synthase subunit A [Beijerinckiaceae bacterium]
MASPLDQFQIKPIVSLGKIGNSEIAFTNSSLFMMLVVLAIGVFFMMATAQRSLVPGRLQSFAEMLYEFVANTLKSAAGKEGMQFFPLVFSLFLFVLTANFMGMIPGSFTVTSHIIVTFALAMVVFLTVIGVGFAKHGTHFLGLFVPGGAPALLVPFLVVIEVISFLSRPISLGMRLFANMLAGHIALKVFAGFVVSLGALGIGGILGATLPLGMIVALTALEFLVAFLQAYVFTILTCVYLNDALHPGH